MAQRKETEYTADILLPATYPQQGDIYLRVPLSMHQYYHDPAQNQLAGIFEGIRKLANLYLDLKRNVIVLFEISDTLDRYNILAETYNTATPTDRAKTGFAKHAMQQAHEKAKEYGDYMQAEIQKLIDEKFAGYSNIKLYQNQHNQSTPGMMRWDTHLDIANQPNRLEIEADLRKRYQEPELDPNSDYQANVDEATDTAVKIQLDGLRTKKKADAQFTYHYTSTDTRRLVQDYIFEEASIMVCWAIEGKKQGITWAMAYPHSASATNAAIFSCLPFDGNLQLTDIVINKKSGSSPNHSPAKTQPVKKHKKQGSKDERIGQDARRKLFSSETPPDTGPAPLPGTDDPLVGAVAVCCMQSGCAYLLPFLAQLVGYIREADTKSPKTSDRDPATDQQERQQLAELIVRFQQQSGMLTAPLASPTKSSTDIPTFPGFARHDTHH